MRWAKKYRRIRRIRKRAVRRTSGSKYTSMMKKKIYRPRPISGRIKVKGLRMRIRRKEEVKRTFYNYFAAGLGDTYSISNFASVPAVIIWSNVGNDTANQPFYTMPAVDASEGGIVGNKFNMRYAEVRFMLFKSANYQPVFTFTSYRIFVIRARQDNIPFNYQHIYTMNNNNFQSPLDTKKWDVMYDKFVVMPSGIQAVTAGTTHQYPGYRPKAYRFIVPLKQTISRNVVSNPFFKPIYICAVGFNANNEWYCLNPCAVYYYTE